MTQQAWAKEGRIPRIAIIGAGMSGIASVVKLREAGYTDLTVFEKADKVGGTWRENSYPGLSCDVPSHWYSFEFAPNSNWRHRYSYGPEIQAYMEDVADRFGVTAITRFNTPVAALTYEGPQWRLETEKGDVEIFDMVICATGVLHHPSVPNFEGLESFEGAAFHSARWDHSVDYEGKRVGVIGSGSTGAQIIGAIGPKVEKLVAFQRTPQWMVPMNQKEYASSFQKFLKAVPAWHGVLRWWFRNVAGSAFVKATTGDKKMQEKLSEIALQHLEDGVADPALRKKLTPSFQAACKRLILCSTYYPAITADNAELVTEAIERIEPKGVRTKDGVLHELDVLALATGFDASSFVLPMRIYGEDKIEIKDVWDGAPRAHRAVSMPGFPNFWMLEGPTGPIGNFSLIQLTEWQLDHLIGCFNKMKADGLAAMVPSQEAYEAYNAKMNVAIKDTVWFTGGCDSWYFDKSGNPNLYPWAPEQYRIEVQNPDFSEYRLIDDVPAQIAAE